MSAKTFFRVFCVLLFSGGAFFAIVLPPFQVPDEIAHFFRAFEVSRGILFPPSVLAMPIPYEADKEIFHPWLERDDVVKSGRLLAVERAHFGLFQQDRGDDVSPPIHAEDIYGFPLYAPGAFALALVRPLHPTLVTALTFARLVTLALCGAIVIAGFRLMPFGKELYAFVALLPMHLEQLASVSPDALVISLALFTTALILRTSFRNTHRPLTLRENACFAALSVAIGFAKIDIVVLSLLVLVPGTRFANGAARFAFITANGVIALIVVALAPRLTTVTSQAFTAFHASTGIEVGANAAFVLHHPVAMARDLRQTLEILGPHYLSEIVGTFGWLSFELPWPYVMLGIAVAGVLALRIVLPHDRRFTLRAVCAVVSGIAFFAVFASLFVTNEAQGDLSGLLSGSTIIPGVQGRYFLPFLLIPGIALAFGTKRHLHVDRFLSAFAASLLLVGSAHTVLVSYYR